MGVTDIFTIASRDIPEPVIRGVQLSTGAILVTHVGCSSEAGYLHMFQDLRHVLESYLSV